MADPNSSGTQTDPNGDNLNPSIGNRLKEAGQQADTVVRNASNLITGGLADQAEAAAHAMFMERPWDWLNNYKASLQQQLDRDADDSTNRPIASAAGDALGVGLSALGGYRLGVKGSASLSNQAKGKLGEALSKAKTVVTGDWPAGSQVPKVMQNGKTTILDHETRKGVYVEAKFGPSARLTPNQQYAQKQWEAGYRVDHWLPQHIGNITAPVGAGGGLLSWGLQHGRVDEEDPDTNPWIDN